LRARIKRGFTLIELSVVIVILVLMSATVYLRLVSTESSRAYRDFRLAVRRLGIEAHEEAISRKQIASVAYDESGPALTLMVEGDDQAEAEIRRVELAPGVEATRFSAGDSDSTGAEWRLRFYPDGRSDGGGIELDSSGQTFAMYAEKSGAVHFADGSLPELRDERWPAGEYERRQ
jgi:prepilin-type N-terminal cleavage/methylation domain-containing protein